MTVAAGLHQPPLALQLIKPFAESGDARLRGNAVVALTALIESDDPDLSEHARDELVRVLCAEPGGSGLDWQRRFAAISVDAVRQLAPDDSRLVGLMVTQNLSKSREPAQQSAIARLILAICDQDSQLWPIGWKQFKRYASLAGRPGFWLCVWAALWRSAIAWMAVTFGSELLEILTKGGFRLSTDDRMAVGFFLTIGSAFIFALIIRLSVPGHFRPPKPVYVRDTILNAIVFGIAVTLGAALVFTLFVEQQYTPPEFDVSAFDKGFDIAGTLVLGVLIGAFVRGIRWASTRVALEPQGTSNLLRPVTALSVSLVACGVVVDFGMSSEMAGILLRILVPAATVFASLDVWLEEVGPRPLLPVEPQVEKRWLLPVVVGACATIFVIILFLHDSLSIFSSAGIT